MSNARRLGEYPSLRAAIEAQMALGLDWRAAAAVVAVARGRPANDKATRSLANGVVNRGGGTIEGRIRLEKPLFIALQRAGAGRAATAFQLANRLIEAAVTSNLIDAILDDGDDA